LPQTAQILPPPLLSAIKPTEIFALNSANNAERPRQKRGKLGTMDKALLRLLYQKRFKLMNQWNADAAFLQPRFGAHGDPVFRSFIFRAFDELLGQLRRQDKDGDATPIAAEQLEMSVFTDAGSCRRAWEIGGQVLENFCRTDAMCSARFPESTREEAIESIREAIAAIQERAGECCSHQEPTTPATLYCIQCGRPLEDSAKAPTEAAPVPAPQPGSAPGS